MTDTDIVTRLAREAGMDYRTPGDYDEMHLPGMDGVDVETLTRFAALVADECAKVCEEKVRRPVDNERDDERLCCADDIRAKFKA